MTHFVVDPNRIHLENPHIVMMWNADVSVYALILLILFYFHVLFLNVQVREFDARLCKRPVL